MTQDEWALQWEQWCKSVDMPVRVERAVARLRSGWMPAHSAWPSLEGLSFYDGVAAIAAGRIYIYDVGDKAMSEIAERLFQGQPLQNLVRKAILFRVTYYITEAPWPGQRPLTVKGDCLMAADSTNQVQALFPDWIAKFGRKGSTYELLHAAPVNEQPVFVLPEYIPEPEPEPEPEPDEVPEPP